MPYNYMHFIPEILFGVGSSIILAFGNMPLLMVIMVHCWAKFITKFDAEYSDGRLIMERHKRGELKGEVFTRLSAQVGPAIFFRTVQVKILEEGLWFLPAHFSNTSTQAHRS